MNLGLLVRNQGGRLVAELEGALLTYHVQLLTGFFWIVAAIISIHRLFLRFFLLVTPWSGLPFLG